MSSSPPPSRKIPETELRYHVPGSQVWGGSAGRQAGHVHIHVKGWLCVGRLKRAPGKPLCGREGWYERPPEHPGEKMCPGCVGKAERHGIPYPDLPSFR